jgi:hypothetical protein
VKRSTSNSKTEISTFLVYHLILGIALAFGCQDSAKELRELDEVEIALGILSDAPNEEREIRLEQLATTNVSTPRIKELKKLCVESYRTFFQASSLLEVARQQTVTIENEIENARQQALNTGGLSPEDEIRLGSLANKAAGSLKQVTDKLDRADALVTACDKKRKSLRAELVAR